jgi:Clathrin adaptor complex small chain
MCTVWPQYSNLYLLAMCRANVNAAAVLAFLHSVLDVFKHYFSELEEESLRDNFVIAYELLDEVRGGRRGPAPSSIHVGNGSSAMHAGAM